MEESIWLVVCNRDSRNELIAVECETLTGKKPVNGIAEGGTIEFVSQAAYLRAGMRVIARGKTMRALINLVRPYAKTILDPCCGTGSILLEAQAMGLDARGGDWNPKMVGMSSRNLVHFGYDAGVELMDARDWPEPSDAIVTDLPYGKGLEASKTVIRGILERARSLAPVAVFVAGSDLTDWLRAVGYKRVELFRVPKYTGFARYVHRAWQSTSSIENSQLAGFSGISVPEGGRQRLS